ncbi:PKD domain-containing protein [Aquimarina sp. AD10]|uniref:PKD domain-containing protein n=1 Tax=Aquimarina aggregata TaxID=1642818 RepID=A0A163CRJ1_9FLAO|nr:MULTISPECIES: PKD domain-containing protein [Aquimarina]AXT59313.1 PKD domain-containing protein [Aquimarina sp. AD10]KZS42687.1 hypothetical protein AWE51_04350 [Aquimarina aggregata]RKM95180.1 PKD domain-containing protein [Aquimarina sp. AD10]
MNKKLVNIFLLTLFTISSFITHSQSSTKHLIAQDQQSFINDLISQKSNQPMAIKISKDETLLCSITLKKQTDQEFTIIGKVDNQKTSILSLSKVAGKLEGNIVLQDSKKAYKIFVASDNKVYIEETDIHSVLCIDYEKVSGKTSSKNTPITKMALELESLPGATGVVYLDFDGEVVTGTSWKGGATINARATSFSDEQILRIWKIMAEDFRPFNINITTRRDIFEAAPRNRRMMCIFTSTDDAAPGSGGVAFLRSFGRSNDNPCWVYNISGSRVAGETGSHEVGHTLGLQHDSQGSTEYYAGHGKWSPIMGWSASRAIGQWSQGEFENANQTQDDIAVMADNNNGVGFRDDDHSNVINNEVTEIKVDSDGNVSASQNFGFIGKRDDKDVFSFIAEAGDVSFDFNPDPDYPNLNIQARLINALGEEIVSSDPDGLSASINETLAAGTYFIEIDGVGEGTPINGYSDYSSLGNYFISGKYTPGDNRQPPVANFEISGNDCSDITFKSTTINKVNSYLWDFGDGTTSTEQSPTHTYTTNGSYTVSLTAVNDIGENKNEKKDYVTINLPEQPVASDQNICPGESANITISGNSEYRWYSEPTGGIVIATGATYNTPALDASQTYYVSGIIGDCTTATRTEVSAIVLEIPTSPTIAVNQNQRLAIDTEFTSYQWFLDGEVLADANGSTYLPEETGTYTLQVANQAGCTALSAEFAVDQSQLNLSLNSKTYTYYPNPVSDDKLLLIDGITANDFNISIVNVLGEVVLRTMPTPELDVSELSKGLYMILIDNKYIGKLVKQ